MALTSPEAHDNPALDLGTDNAEVTIRDEKCELKNEEKMPTDLLYAVDDVPPWYLCVALAFQHYLMMFGGIISVPFILAPAMCMAEDNPDRAALVSTIIFVSGIITLLQVVWGVRLPIVQGGTFTLLVPTLALLRLPDLKCPDPEVVANLTSEEQTELWQVRMRHVQGAITVSCVFELLLGFTGFLCERKIYSVGPGLRSVPLGVVGLLLKYITPLTIAPAIALIGLSLFDPAAQLASQHWGVALGTIIVIIVLSQYLKDIPCLFPSYTRNEGWKTGRYNIFSLLSVLIGIILLWFICAVLTIADVVPISSAIRTDKKLRIVAGAPWIRLPYPFQWGIPTVTVVGVFGMLSGILASTVESVGDYYACARLAGASAPPVHAINRGIGIEGLGGVLAGLWGSGNGTTSYSQNIGAIGITKVGSRRVIIYCGFLMLILGLCSKLGAFFITIPEPIVGGVFCVMFAIVTAVGLSSLQYVDMNSSRNLFVLGFAIFFSFVVAEWVKTHPDAIQTGSEGMDQIITVLLSTSMFLGGILGFVFDNTVPGTDEERGLIAWRALQAPSSNVHASDPVYDLPWITTWLRKYSWTRWVPFFPTYKPLQFRGGMVPCRTRKDTMA